MKDTKNVMVCVTQQKTCERLILEGAEIRNHVGGRLLVIHVTPNASTILGSSSQPEALDYLFEISKSVEAELTVIRSSDTVNTLINFAHNQNVGIIVMGESLQRTNDNSIIDELNAKIDESIEIRIVPV